MQTSTNPFAFRGPITIDTLGDLFAHHRDLTGGFRMEGDTGGGTGGGDGSGAGDTGSQGGGQGGGTGGGDGSTYTPPASQADLDRIIGQRVAREREKYADYEAMKAKAEAHDKALEAAKTDAEKAVDAARREGESTATQAANARIVAAESRALAAESGFRIGAASVVRLLDLTGVKVGDDGAVDTEAIKTKLEALKTAEPDLVAEAKKTGPKKDKSQGGGSDDKPTLNRGAERARQRHPQRTRAAS